MLCEVVGPGLIHDPLTCGNELRASDYTNVSGCWVSLANMGMLVRNVFNMKIVAAAVC